MSLLLDARKKSKGGSNSPPELALSLEPDTPAPPGNESVPQENARSAGQNLFKAKTSASAAGQVNRKLIYALLGSVALFGAGAVYVWSVTSANDRPLAQAVVRTATVAPTAAVAPPPTIVEPAAPKPDNLVAAMAAPDVHQANDRITSGRSPVTKRIAHQTQQNLSVNLTPDKADMLDMLLNNAYQAYRSGKFEQAQLLYRDVLSQDPRNTDALLGLAAIAQHRGADALAVQYYGKVLALDPRNAVANAGMSALSTDENHESRLKMLLAEQKDSPSLLFALGNQYADQARWGEAQQAYFNAYKLESDNADLAFNLAISLEHLGQNKLSSQYYQRAVQLDTGNSAGFDHATTTQHALQLAP